MIQLALVYMKGLNPFIFRQQTTYDITDHCLVLLEQTFFARRILQGDSVDYFSHDRQLHAESFSFQDGKLDILITGRIIFQCGGLAFEPLARIYVRLGARLLCLRVIV